MMPIDDLINSRIRQYRSELQHDVDRCKSQWHPHMNECRKCAGWHESLTYLESLQIERDLERMAA